MDDEKGKEPDSCGEGACAFCNPHHPDHKEAAAYFDMLLGALYGNEHDTEGGGGEG